MDCKYKVGSFTEIQEVNGVQVVVDRSGEALPQLPKTQFNIGATQTFPTSTGELSLHADYSYISRQYFNPVTAAPGASAEVKAAYAEQNALSDKIGRASCRAECVRTCRSRWSPYPKKKNHNTLSTRIY